MRSVCAALLLSCLLAAGATPAGAVGITKIGFVDLQRVLSALPAPGAPTAPPRSGSVGNQQEIRDAIGDLSSDYYTLLIEELHGDANPAAVNRGIDNLLALLAPAPATAATAPPVTSGASMDRILSVVDRVGREQGYSLILEKSNLLFGHPAIDITDAVIAALQAPEPSPATR